MTYRLLNPNIVKAWKSEERHKPFIPLHNPCTLKKINNKKPHVCSTYYTQSGHCSKFTIPYLDLSL